jgi:GT2 family glycosyltransferase
VGLNAMFRNSTIFNSEYYGNWQRDSERAVDIVTGCFLLMRQSDWNRLGGFDDAFVMYGEEVDLCLRGMAAGMAPRVTPDATIVHYGGASEKVQADKMVRLLRAKVLLIKRHFPASQRALGLLLFRLWPWSRILPGRLWRGDAADWTEIWARRREWWDGWPEAKIG